MAKKSITKEDLFNFHFLRLSGPIQPKMVNYFSERIDDYFNWSKNIFVMSRHWELENTDFPFEHESYFQNLLPDFQSFSAKAL